MKLRKTIAAVSAATIAAAAVSLSASATLKVPDNPAPGTAMSTGMYNVKVFCPDEKVENDFDWSTVASMTIRIHPDEVEWFDGSFGGAFFTSCGPTSVTPEDHNWCQMAFWGVIDEEHEIYTLDEGSPVIFEPVGDYVYEATLNLDDSNCIYKEVLSEKSGYVQIGLMEWGQNMTDMVVDYMILKDKNGNVICTCDTEGNVTMAAASTAAPADTATTDAPATTTTTTTTTTTAGNVQAATDSSKGSPDTGIGDVAAVAGIAVAAAGALIIAKKRK